MIIHCTFWGGLIWNENPCFRILVDLYSTPSIYFSQMLYLLDHRFFSFIISFVYFYLQAMASTDLCIDMKMLIIFDADSSGVLSLLSF